MNLTNTMGGAYRSGARDNDQRQKFVHAKVFDSCPENANTVKTNEISNLFNQPFFFLSIRRVHSPPPSPTFPSLTPPLPRFFWDRIVNWLTLSKQEILKLIKEMSLENLDKAEVIFFPLSLSLSQSVTAALCSVRRLATGLSAQRKL